MSSDYNSNQFVSTNTGAASASCSSSRWLTEEVFKLIDIVQRDEAIYNPRHKYYFCRPYVENFWREVDLKLEKNPGASLAKWTNLRISFRREYTNYLEEKVPPCWSYFDRMFFLGPFLRKKHQQSKSLDTQVQDALAHLSSLSSRMQRERAVAACPTGAANTTHANNRSAISSAQQSPQAPQLDNYLDYFDEQEPNNSELDDIIEDEQRLRFQNRQDNDIKSECEDDYEPDTRASSQNLYHHQHDEDDHEDNVDRMATAAAATSSVATTSTVEKRYIQHQQQKLQLNRVQMRSYHDEVRGLRPRSQDLQTTNAVVAAAAAASAANLQTHSNISFVRPTFTKPVDMVSTTTHSSSGSGIPPTDGELPTPTNPSAASSGAAIASAGYIAQRHIAHYQSPQRLEASTTLVNGNGGTVDLCDCKSDPDAMFLMSLLPDIQKLNGRDRGKIKIAFQNILQDYLYPD